MGKTDIKLRSEEACGGPRTLELLSGGEDSTSLLTCAILRGRGGAASFFSGEAKKICRQDNKLQPLVLSQKFQSFYDVLTGCCGCLTNFSNNAKTVDEIYFYPKTPDVSN